MLGNMKTTVLSSLLLLCIAVACIQTGLAINLSRPGKYAALATFNAAMISTITDIEERAQHLTELVSH